MENQFALFFPHPVLILGPNFKRVPLVLGVFPQISSEFFEVKRRLVLIYTIFACLGCAVAAALGSNFEDFLTSSTPPW